MTELERIVDISPAFDKRDSDPKKNYGVHGCNLKMVLKGPLGAVQFVLYTNWHLPHVEKELDAKLDSQFPHLSCHPIPADLGYHSPVALYESQEPISGECEFVNGPCYFGGSGLNATSIYRVLLERGSDGVWQELENYYRHIFEAAEWSLPFPDAWMAGR